MYVNQGDFSLLARHEVGITPDCFFFFQAEDGIRDHCVTGVQTCALPICRWRRHRGQTPSPDRKWFVRLTGSDRGDVATYGKPHVNLGGLQIETRANRARTLTTSTRHGIVLLDRKSVV